MPRPLKYAHVLKVGLTDTQHSILNQQARALGTSKADIVRGLIEHHIERTTKPIKRKAS